MEPIDIQYQLKKRGITQKAIAEETGKSETIVSMVIRKERVSAQVMTVISGKLDKSPKEVFPEYFLQPPKRKTSMVA